MEDKLLIKCPYCGREYLPCEIYYPDDFLGSAKNIVHDKKSIIYFDGENMNLKESYICDNCGKEFDVEAKVEFITTKSDFDDDEYSTKL